MLNESARARLEVEKRRRRHGSAAERFEVMLLSRRKVYLEMVEFWEARGRDRRVQSQGQSAFSRAR
jgi:hypothetical protein